MGHILAVISAFAVLYSASAAIGLIFNQYKLNSMVQRNTVEKQGDILILKIICPV